MFITSTRSGWIRARPGSAPLCLLFYFFLSAPLCPGQVIQSAHFELPLAERENVNFKVISAGEKGIVLYRNAIARDNQPGIEIIRLDTALKSQWKGFIPIDGNMLVERASLSPDNVYLLLRDPFRRIGNFQVIAVSWSKQQYTAYKISNAIPFTPVEFVVTGTAVLIGGYFNYRPLVLHYSLTTQQARILPGFLNEPGDLIQLKVYENGAADVITGAKSIEGRKCLWIRNYDVEGNLNKTIIVSPGPGKHLLFGQSVKMPDDEQVVAGVYGRHLELSRGVFVAHIDPYGEYQVNYYNFGDLKHFFNYMKAKREKRVTERIERRKIQGKKIKFDYRFLVHGLIPYQDQYLLIGEAFYPTYSYRGDAYSRTVVFTGYQYTHAVVMGLSKSGKLLWDNSFAISDLRSFELKEFVKTYPLDNNIILLYMFKNRIRSKIIKDNKVWEGNRNEALEPKSKYNKMNNDDIDWSQLEYWYQGNFYSYGVQHVKDLSTGDDGSQRVFFVNKVSYR